MRVLALYNRYRERGGEDEVFEQEVELLRTRGCRVTALDTGIPRVDRLDRRLAAGARVTWSAEWRKRVFYALREERYDILHVHNWFPSMSPSVVWAGAEAGAGVVVTLHNFRLLCVNALLFRDGRICEDCVGRVPWRGVLYGCYRGRGASAAVGAMLVLHRAIGTWEKVGRFIALTRFGREKFIEGGLPAERVAVKPNFVDRDPGVGEGRGGYALFVGRLAPHKGVGTLLAAWQRLGGRVPLLVVGDGPMAGYVGKVARRQEAVTYVGRLPRQEVLCLMRSAAFLIFPSEWYEGFPMVIAEAFATGLPVVASDPGGMRELVEPGRAGLLFRPGDSQDLADKVDWLASNPEYVAGMRREARAEYEARYTAGRNYEMLIEIYQRALEHRL